MWRYKQISHSVSCGAQFFSSSTQSWGDWDIEGDDLNFKKWEGEEREEKKKCPMVIKVWSRECTAHGMIYGGSYFTWKEIFFCRWSRRAAVRLPGSSRSTTTFSRRFGTNKEVLHGGANDSFEPGRDCDEADLEMHDNSVVSHWCRFPCEFLFYFLVVVFFRSTERDYNMRGSLLDFL